MNEKELKYAKDTISDDEFIKNYDKRIIKKQKPENNPQNSLIYDIILFASTFAVAYLLFINFLFSR